MFKFLLRMRRCLLSRVCMPKGRVSPVFKKIKYLHFFNLFFFNYFFFKISNTPVENYFEKYTKFMVREHDPLDLENFSKTIFFFKKQVNSFKYLIFFFLGILYNYNYKFSLKNKLRFPIYKFLSKNKTMPRTSPGNLRSESLQSLLKNFFNIYYIKNLKKNFFLIKNNNVFMGLRTLTFSTAKYGKASKLEDSF